MALKIVYKICCGIDVHKNFVVACIAKTDKQGITTYERHHFSNLHERAETVAQMAARP